MKKNAMKLIIILMITSLVMSLFATAVYSVYAKPRFVEQFIALGNKYLDDGKYEEAILEFNKAIQIEAKSTTARVGSAKGHIGIDDVETAVDLLKQAQEIDITNELLLIEMIELIKDLDPQAAYDMLMRYINEVGENAISGAIREMLDSAKEDPVIPVAVPVADTYAKPFSVRFVSDKVRIGHILRYTTNGTDPSADSDQYRAPIRVEENITIKIVGYNPAGNATEIETCEYILDTSIANDLEYMLAEARADFENTSTGTEVGNCIPGAKESFEPVMRGCIEIFERSILSYNDANYAYTRINDALYAFRQQIIVPTDRTALSGEIDSARQLLQGATEGNNVGNYRNGAKVKLQGVLDSCVPVFDSLISRQEQIDDAKNRLTTAIDGFKSSKITELDKIFIDAGAKTGKVTVSLLWNTNDDLDLHVTSPKGDTIYYSNKRGSSGGQLDVDRQVTEFVTNPIENIYWDNPPSGRYTVKVNVYTKRSNGSIPLKVRVLVNGESTLYELNVSGGMNNICTFDF